MSERKDPRPIKDDERARLTLARDWLIEHADECPTFEEAAKIAKLSPFHFHRRFQLCFGKTPKGIVVEQQIAKAKQFLLAGERVDRIATLCGFAHASHFCSRFKLTVGQMPTEWLAAARRQD